MQAEPNDHESEASAPPPLLVRVSVDGAQRLLDAWHDGRLERALGFPVASLQIHTPFAPAPPSGAGPAAPAPAPAPMPGSAPGTPRWKLGLGVVVGVLALMLALATLLVRAPQRATPVLEAPAPEGGAGARSSMVEASTSHSAESSGAAAELSSTSGVESTNAAAAAASTSGTGVDTDPPAGSSSTASEENDTGLVAPMSTSTSTGTEVGAVPEAQSSGAASLPKKKAVRPPPPKALAPERIDSHYHCQTEGAGFAIVVQARTAAAAKVAACGSAGDSEVCIATTDCNRLDR